jgi:rod shape-determining protein MreD
VAPLSRQSTTLALWLIEAVVQSVFHVKQPPGHAISHIAADTGPTDVRTRSAIAASDDAWDTPPRRDHRPSLQLGPSQAGRAPRIDCFMSLLLAAVGATVAALIETTIVPYVEVGQAHPHPVLVFGAIWTVALGIEGGLTWAFVGGIALDVLADRPLGSSAFALLVATGIAAGLARAMSHLRPIAPIVAVLVASAMNSVLLLALFSALRDPIPVSDPAGLLLPGLAYDVLLAALIGPLVVAIRDRRLEQERVDW